MSQGPLHPDLEAFFSSVGLSAQGARGEELQGPALQLLRGGMQDAQALDRSEYEDLAARQDPEASPLMLARDVAAAYATGEGAVKLLSAAEELGAPAIALLAEASTRSIRADSGSVLDRESTAGWAVLTRHIGLALMMEHRAFALQMLKEASGDPREWPLGRHLVQSLLAYGTTDDESIIPALEEAYARAHCFLPTAIRAELASDTADQVDRGKLSANALMPFLFHEASQSVVSTAALRFAVVAAREDDPLAGVRYLVESGRQAARPNCLVDIVSGLLLLGDRRIIKHLGACWRWFDGDQRRRLSQMGSGYLHAALIDWYLDWLEDCEGSEFGAVAGSLVKMAVVARTQPVCETRRALPVTSVPVDQAVDRRETWSYSEFGRRIESRLRALQQYETPPYVIPELLKEWGVG